MRSLCEMKWEEMAEFDKVGFPGRSEWVETVELLMEYYIKLVSIIRGLQCVQRTLLSSSLHAFQAYDDGDYRLVEATRRVKEIGSWEPPLSTPLLHPSSSSRNTDLSLNEGRLHRITYYFSSSRLLGWRDVEPLLAYVGQMKSVASSQRR